ncbi:hypothetical protein RFI_00064, partial [Reticulomyxa filosa]
EEFQVFIPNDRSKQQKEPTAPLVVHVDAQSESKEEKEEKLAVLEDNNLTFSHQEDLVVMAELGKLTLTPREHRHNEKEEEEEEEEEEAEEEAIRRGLDVLGDIDEYMFSHDSNFLGVYGIGIDDTQEDIIEKQTLISKNEKQLSNDISSNSEKRSSSRTLFPLTMIKDDYNPPKPSNSGTLFQASKVLSSLQTCLVSHTLRLCHI